MIEVVAQLVGERRASILPPGIFAPPADLGTISYLLSATTLGALSALASLLGDTAKILSWRVILAYVISGGLASVGLVLLLAEKYGFSYFLIGVAIFAGYKAFEVFAIISIAITNLVRRLLGKK